MRVITARMDYLPRDDAGTTGRRSNGSGSRDPREAIVSLYARGRDYHKVLRARLQQLADRIADAIGPFGHRVFTDSAPVLEVELAARSGLGWRGKHTLVLDRDAGSMFFLGEIYVDLALPPTDAGRRRTAAAARACIDVCPTQAIVAPYRLDARRCISYLTIEHAGPIPVELRAADRQPHLRLRRLPARLPVEQVRAAQRRCPTSTRAPALGAPRRCSTLWRWSEDEFLRRTEGSPIRRIGHERWLRNIAVALGNALRARRADARRSRAALRRAPRRRRARWCASTSTGRCGSAASRRSRRCRHDRGAAMPPATPPMTSPVGPARRRARARPHRSSRRAAP